MQHVITLITAHDNPVPLDERLINKAIIALEGIKATVTNVKWLATDRAADIFFEGSDPVSTMEALRKKLVNKEGVALPVDFIAQVAETRRKKMLIADMDSTIINQECIDELADVMGIKPQIAEITKRAMNGELEFQDALRERIKLLTGLPEEKLVHVYTNHITLAHGAEKLVRTMAKHDAHCRLVSGGFTFFTNRIRDAVGFHADEANQLVFEDGQLTGEVAEPILDKESKLKSLQDTSKALGISTDDVLAIGDGANDIPMLKAAGLGVACHAKPNVRSQVPAQLNVCGLDALLYVQGYSDEDIVR